MKKNKSIGLRYKILKRFLSRNMKIRSKNTAGKELINLMHWKTVDWFSISSLTRGRLNL